MADCPRCGSEVIEVPVDLGADRLSIVRCARCDAHQWEREGVVIELDEVLDLTSAWAAGNRPAAGRPRKTPAG